MHLMEIDLNLLHVSAYTAIVVVLIYLATYSYMFDWWKSSLGRAMNTSLIFSAVAALGIVIRFAVDMDIGRALSVVGWLGFSVAVMWRLRVLILAYNQLRRPITSEEADELERKNPNFVAPDPFDLKETLANGGTSTERDYHLKEDELDS